MARNIIKTLLAVLCVITCTVALVACGGSSSGDNQQNNLLNFEGITFENQTFDYDGNEHEIKIKGNLPENADVKYSNNKATNAGTYNATATITHECYNTLNLNANLVINKINFTGITFSDKTVEYNSTKQSIELVGDIPANSTVKIKYNDQEVDGVTEVGEYTVKLEITNINYNKYEKTAKLKITSTEERLNSVYYNNKLYFQNNLDSNKLYSYDGTTLTKVNDDKAEYFTVNGNSLYYYSSSLFSKVIKSFDGAKASNLFEINGEYLTSDGTYLYYVVNNLVKTSTNGIYKIKLDGSEEPKRLVKNKAEYLTYYNGKIYYSNVSDGRKLYSVSTSASEQENGSLLVDEKVSDIILDNGVLYFNSTKTTLGVGIASAIRKYTISSATNVKLTSDNGAYLTKVGSYVYYVIRIFFKSSSVTFEKRLADIIL